MTRTPRARAVFDFQQDEVIGIIQPPTAPAVGRGQPGRADNCHEHLAGRHRPGDFLGKVQARLDRVHIDEDLAFAETIDESVIQPASKMVTVLPSVADKNATALSYWHAHSRYRKATGVESCQLTFTCK